MSMSNKKPKPLQIRVLPEGDGAELIKKIEEIAERNGVSANTVVNFAVAAGIGVVEDNWKKLRNPPEKQAA